MKVSIISCSDYDYNQVNNAICESLELIDAWSDINLNGKRVLLKPNILTRRPPDYAVTTHPEVLRSVIRIVKDRGGTPYVGDSPASRSATDAAFLKTCEITGILQVTREEGVELARFDKSFSDVDNPEGKVYKKFPISDAVIGADLIINLPKLKTHGLTGLTLSSKNLFGCIPGFEKPKFHLKTANLSKNFSEVILDLAILIKPCLNIMDAIVGMDGPGPSGGNTKFIGTILTSLNTFALDITASQIVGYNPLELPIERGSIERGYIKIEDIEIVGSRIEDVFVDDFKKTGSQGLMFNIPGPVGSFLKDQLTAKPVYDYDKCVGCMDCLIICPAKAISQMEEGRKIKSFGRRRLRIDYNKCIRCYCCQEVCKYSAINLKKSLLGRFI